MNEIVFCGLFGACASVFGKISLSDLSPPIKYLSNHCLIEFPNFVYCKKIIYLVRFVSFLAMLYTNALMLSMFMKALEKRNSLPVTVGTSAINFLFTGILGNLILRENINSQWFLGALLIASGVLLIALSQTAPKR